jgi:hypothetical protein
MKHFTIRFGILLAIFFFGITGVAFAGDIKAALDTNDGSTKFKVQDSDSQDVAHIDSDGDGYFKGKVGIGTTDTSAAELVVNGNIAASPPTADDHVATKAYVDASSGGGGPSFAGYTATTYDGNIGGIIGMNAKCELEYPGSHACTYDEIIRLGASFPNTVAAWIIDGTLVSGTRDGSDAYSVGYPNCVGWHYNTSNYRGAYIHPTYGGLILVTCDASRSIPCCE